MFCPSFTRCTASILNSVVYSCLGIFSIASFFLVEFTHDLIGDEISGNLTDRRVEVADWRRFHENPHRRTGRQTRCAIAMNEAGIQASCRAVRRLIERENECGIPTSRVFLAGFSQGGAMAYTAALAHP